MQLRSTTIKHKRYSVKGWSDKNPDGSFKNTLAQGEIGVLLSQDLETVLEVRIGIKDNSSFYEGVLLGSNDANIDLCIRQYPNKVNFPSVGSEYSLYIAKNSNTAYRWDDADMKYYCVSASPGQGDGWWEEINGGAAIISQEFLGTSTPI